MVANGQSDPLGDIPLFRDLSFAELALLHEQLHLKRFPAGITFITADDRGDVAYIIVGGTVKIYVANADGSEVILAILGPGDVVGEMSVVDSLGRSASAVTLDHSTLLCMDRANFWHCLRTMPTMSYNLVDILSRRLRSANAHIRALATLDIHGRVARQLLDLASTYGEPAPLGGVRIRLRLTQYDLASLVGASRVRVNQVFATFKQHHYVSIDEDHQITVHDLAALARRCE